MKKFLEIKCLDEKEEIRLVDKIEKVLAAKKKEKLFIEREIKEIEEMKLEALLDIQDIQSVYEDLMYKNNKGKKTGDSNE